MCWPIIAAVAVAAVSAIQSQQQSQAQASQMKYQAALKENEAIVSEHERGIARDRTALEQRAVDIERAKAAREFKEMQGKNINIMAAGNVDLSSGSPLAILDGGAARFSEEQAERGYQRELIGWTGRRQDAVLKYQRDMALSQSQFLRSSAPTEAQSFFGAIGSGVMSGASAYASMGGFKGGTAKAPTTGTTSTYTPALSQGPFLHGR